MADNVINTITTFLNSIYNIVEISEEWLLIIPIPKERTAKSCEDYRILSIMKMLMKINAATSIVVVRN